MSHYINSMEHSPSSATKSYSSSQEIPYHSYGTQRLITMFITACHWFQSYARWIPPTPSCPFLVGWLTQEQ